MSGYDGYVLVRYNDNYADEFDITGGMVMPFKEYAEWFYWFSQAHRMIAKGHTFEYYFGTNEAVYYGDVLGWVRAFEIRGIDDAGVRYLREFVGEVFCGERYCYFGWGHFPNKEQLKWFVEECLKENKENEPEA